MINFSWVNCCKILLISADSFCQKKISDQISQVQSCPRCDNNVFFTKWVSKGDLSEPQCLLCSTDLFFRALTHAVNRLGVVKPMWTALNCLVNYKRQLLPFWSHPFFLVVHTLIQTQSFHHSLSVSPCLPLLQLCRQTVAKWLPLSPLVSVAWLVHPLSPTGWVKTRSKVRQRELRASVSGLDPCISL